MAHAISIPRDRPPPPKDLEIRPRQVKAWLESLPLQQSAEATRQLRAHLGALNRVRLDPETRIQILDVCRPVADALLDDLDAVYGKAALPMAARQREALALARELAGDMALGYRIAVAEKSGKLFGARKQLPLLALRAIEYLARSLRASYRAYTPVLAGTWAQLHEAYLHVEGEGVAGEAADPESRASVLDAYVEILLLALTDPYRLPQGEPDRILAQLRAHRGLASLAQSRPATPTGGHFLVPCDLDKQPKPSLSASDDTGGPNWRLLDANALVEKLRAKRGALEAGHVSAAMSKAMGADGPALLAKLVTLWGDPPKRAARRDPAEATVAICAGLKAVSQFVSLEPKIDLATEDEMVRRGITMPLFALPVDDASQPIPVYEWEVLNTSKGGLKVRRMGHTQQPIAVGELLGIKLTGKAHWAIGTVRWITLFEEGGMEFGLQFLAPMARAVWVQPTITSSPQAKGGLLLGDGSASDDTLATPPNTYSELREFEIDEDGAVCRVRARNLLEKTARFELFHVIPS